MKFEKMTVPSRPTWPNGIECDECGRGVQPGDSVLAGHHYIKGSVVFHKGCIIDIVQSAWPESMFDQIREEIIANPDRVFATT